MAEFQRPETGYNRMLDELAELGVLRTSWDVEPAPGVPLADIVALDHLTATYARPFGEADHAAGE